MADFEINRRLKHLIIDVYKTTPFDFSKRYNDNGGVKTSAIMRERNGVSNNMLEAICLAYPEINRSWLLTGEGEMLKESQNGNGGNIVNSTGDGNHITSSVNADMASFIELLKNRDVQIAKKDQQIDRLLTIIEHQNGINNQ